MDDNYRHTKGTIQDNALAARSAVSSTAGKKQEGEGQLQP